MSLRTKTSPNLDFISSQITIINSLHTCNIQPYVYKIKFLLKLQSSSLALLKHKGIISRIYVVQLRFMQTFSLLNFIDVIYATYCRTFLHLLWLWYNIFNAYRYIHIMSFLNVYLISYSLCEKANYDFAPSYVIIILTFTVVYFVYSDFSMTSALFRWLLFIWLLHLLQKALILHRWLNRIFCTCSHWNKKLYDGISDNDNTFTVFTCSIFKIMVHVHLAQCILKIHFHLHLYDLEKR